MGDADCPFRTMDKLLEELGDKPLVSIVDFHAEATSEKNALGRYLDGRVSAVVGTHTHVGTADTRILPHGTAFVTDIGMVGPSDSVIGDDAEAAIRRFLTHMPHRLSVGKGRVLFNKKEFPAAEEEFKLGLLLKPIDSPYYLKMIFKARQTQDRRQRMLLEKKLKQLRKLSRPL